MRVLLSLSWYRPHISGVTLALDRLARELAARGHAVTVLTGRHQKSLPREETSGGIRIRRVWVAACLGKALIMPGIFGAAWREAGRADIVHLWLPQFDAALVAIAARLRRRPVMATYNCSLTSPGMAGALAVAAVNLSHLIAGFFCRRIVVISDDYARQSRFCRIFRRKIVHIDVPVPDWPETPRPYRPPAPPYRIGFIGRLAREKGLETLIAAVEPLRARLGADFSVEIAGPGDLPELFAGAPPQIRHLGTLDEAARDAFLRGLDLLVLPSHDRIEAWGLVQVEAMLRGVPCIASDRPGMRQPVARTGFGRLFTPRDPVALAEAAASVLKHGPPRRPAPEEIAAMFSNAGIARRYAALYAAAASRGGIAARLRPG